MSFRGGNRGRGGSRGDSRGRGRGGFGNSRGRGGFGKSFETGPPEHVIEVGQFMHKCENDLVCTTTCGKIPFFNAHVYFENKEQIGKIDEIFGSPQENGFSVKLSEGVKAGSFKEDQKLYIDPAKLLPVERFLPGASSNRGSSRGGGRGRGRGGFNTSRGSRGGNFTPRGNSRGGRGGFNNSRGGEKRRGSFGGNSGPAKRGRF